MLSTTLKPTKIKISNGTASGMYLLLKDDEVRYTDKNETKPPNRIYQLQIAVEVMYNNKRCRGKRTYDIPKGTSIIKAVELMQKHREDIKSILRQKGTLKSDTAKLGKINTKDRKLSSIFEAWISGKKITQRANTIKTYDSCYRIHLSVLKNKVIDEITTDDIQNIINKMINDKKSSATILTVKMVMKPLLEVNDIMLNWKKIIFPKNEVDRKYKGTDDEAIKIAQVLTNYPHKIAKGVFSFLLTGRRINETLQLKYENIDYENNTFTIPKEFAKTKKEFTFGLTPALIKAIKSQNTTKGIIFAMGRDSAIYHFKKAMRTIGIYDMVMHDLRSMIAVTALRNGANIYDVSKMLSHSSLATTEAKYITGGTEQATNAQSVFSELTAITYTEDIEDVEIIEDKFTQLKKIYPNATDEKIQQIMELMNE